MADGEVDREVKFRDAALVLADDVAEMAGKLRSCVRGKKYRRGRQAEVMIMWSLSLP